MKSPFAICKWKAKLRAQLWLLLGWKSSSNRTSRSHSGITEQPHQQPGVTLCVCHAQVCSQWQAHLSGEVQRRAAGEELQKFRTKPREGAEGWHMSFSVHQGDVLGRIICRIIWIMFTWFWTHNWQPALQKMLLESPWTTLLKPQLSVPWQPESQDNGKHPQGGSSSLGHLLWGGLCAFGAWLE